jgi:D-tyrosyl-tRNA(Tyr) deacylase
MRAVVQRVEWARVEVAGELIGAIDSGLCVFVGVGRDDTDADVDTLADKVVGLRIFEDEQGRMNRSVSDVAGQVLAVSQFTLFGDARRGRRPSFTEAMEPAGANALFEAWCGRMRQRGVAVATGRFRAQMRVELLNDGPVTILLDTRKAF